MRIDGLKRMTSVCFFSTLISVFGFDDDRVIGRVWDFCYCCCCCGCDRVYIELIKWRRKKCRDRRLCVVRGDQQLSQDQRPNKEEQKHSQCKRSKWTELCVCVCLRGIIVIFCMPTSLFLSLSVLCVFCPIHSWPVLPVSLLARSVRVCVCAASVWSGAIWVIVCIAYTAIVKSEWLKDSSQKSFTVIHSRLLIKWLARSPFLVSINQRVMIIVLAANEKQNRFVRPYISRQHTHTHQNHNYLGSFTQPYHFHILCFMFSLRSAGQNDARARSSCS